MASPGDSVIVQSYPCRKGWTCQELMLAGQQSFLRFLTFRRTRYSRLFKILTEADQIGKCLFTPVRYDNVESKLHKGSTQPAWYRACLTDVVERGDLEEP